RGAYGLERGVRTGHRGGAGEAGSRVDLAVEGGSGLDLPGGEPAGQLALERRAQPGDDEVAVDVDAHPVGQGVHGGLDPHPGVDERHIQVESHSEHPTRVPAAVEVGLRRSAALAWYG